MVSKTKDGKRTGEATAKWVRVYPYPVSSRQKIIQDAVVVFQQKVRGLRLDAISGALSVAGEPQITTREAGQVCEAMGSDEVRHLPFDFSEEELPF